MPDLEILLGVAMTVTKSYVARNYGVRDRIIDNLGAVAAVLVLGFVLLFLSGALDFGRDISITVQQASVSSPHR
jgi:VanZ family protein